MQTRRKILVGAGAAAAAGAAAFLAVRESDYDDAVAAVWAPRASRGPADFGYLVHYAVLAANSHNTQPWRFAMAGNRVTIAPDFARSTPAADPDRHHLFASLGCASENLVLAARAAGRDASAVFDGAGDGSVGVELANGSATADPLFEAILERQSTRSDYDRRTVPADEIHTLEAAARVNDGRVIFITDRRQIEQALEFIVAANTRQVGDPAFASELKSWVRFNAEQAVATHDGLYAACAGNPDLPTWLGRGLFRFVFMAKSENDRYARQVRSSAGLAVFVSGSDDKAHWVDAGRSYQRFALQATRLGIRNAFINQPVEIAEVRSEFASWLGIAGMRPDLVVRFGYAPPMPKSLRRPVAAVIA